MTPVRSQNVTITYTKSNKKIKAITATLIGNLLISVHTYNYTHETGGGRGDTGECSLYWQSWEK